MLLLYKPFEFFTARPGLQIREPLGIIVNGKLLLILDTAAGSKPVGTEIVRFQDYRLVLAFLFIKPLHVTQMPALGHVSTPGISVSSVHVAQHKEKVVTERIITFVVGRDIKFGQSKGSIYFGIAVKFIPVTCSKKHPVAVIYITRLHA